MKLQKEQLKHARDAEGFPEMGLQNSPDSPEDVVNILSKAGYLKAENDQVAVSLESANTINVQPKGSIWGAKARVEKDGSITPTLTFDTKKLRENPNHVDPSMLLDKALEDFWDQSNDQTV